MESNKIREHRKPKKFQARSDREIKITLTPFEREIHLASFIKYQIDGTNVGAQLLQWGDPQDPHYKIIFGFKTTGVHPTLRDEEVLPTVRSLESGFRVIPEGESLTFVMSSHRSDLSRQQELSSLVDINEDSIVKFALMAEKSQCQKLNNMGKRSQKKLILWATSSSIISKIKNTYVEQAVEIVLNLVGKINKSTDKKQLLRLYQFINDSYYQAFDNWKNTLTSTMGFDIVPMTVEEVWEECWLTLNGESTRKNLVKVPPVPNYLTYDSETLEVVQNSYLDPRSELIKYDKAIPEVIGRKSVRVDNKYIGLLSLIGIPEGWEDDYYQLTYLWDIFAKTQLSGLTITTTVVGIDQRITREALQRVTKQSISYQSTADRKGTVNVIANKNMELAIEAQEDLFGGEIAARFSTVFSIEADTQQEVDHKCTELSSKVLYPAELLREVDVAWETWVQTLPYCKDVPLSKPAMRAIKAKSSDLPGYVPAVNIASIDRSGMEYITEEGQVPFYFDPFGEEHKGLLVLATTRAGKSLMLGDLIVHARARGLPVSITDKPPTDEVSTFEDMCNVFGGSYVDVVSTSLNPFEIPDLSGVNPKQQESLEIDYRDNLVQIIDTMVMGTHPEQTGYNPSIIKSVLQASLNIFFEDVVIRERYATAIRGGLGSSAWRRYPILEDFVPFCTLEYLGLDDDESARAIDYIQLRFRSWLEGRYKKSLNAPSTIEVDNPLFVLALRGISDDTEVAVFSLLSNSVVLRRAMGMRRSIAILDEASLQCRLDPISLNYESLIANSGKSGMRCVLSGQDPKPIATSAGGSGIMANLNNQLIGRIEAKAIDNFEEHCKIPREFLEINAGENFFPNYYESFSRWLHYDGRKFTYLRKYISPQLVKLLANNTHEIKARKNLFSLYPNDPLKALVELCK